MQKRIYTGIDIGTYHVKVIIAAPSESPDLPMTILGTGVATSRGLRHGYIVDQNEAVRSVREALSRAKTSAKTNVTSARVAVGGVGLDEIRSNADISLTASGGIVTARDVERVLRESEKRASAKLVNRTVLHTIPLEYRIDGTPVYGKPTGMQGTKLTVDTLIISMLTQHYDDLLEAVEAAGIEVDGVMASPLAASLVTLTKAQKTAGVCLANIGAETLSVIVFDNDTPVSLKVFPTGSSDVTSSIALNFQIPMNEAEQMKRGAVTGSDISPRKIEQLVASQLKDMFTLINGHLKTIGRSRLLPAGIVITGGGSGFGNAADIARLVTKLPSSVAQVGTTARTMSMDATWAVAYGLCRWAYADDSTPKPTSIKTLLTQASERLKEAVRAILP
ncbi:cell division protein FtsA [Candidatus Kaiserbacteria bacterium]|nr:cell division protein FtsA [Candidatus Kaiserbacteria bacterium]